MPDLQYPHDYRNHDRCVPGITSPCPETPQQKNACEPVPTLEAKIFKPRCVYVASDRLACAEIQWHVHAGIEVADKPAKRCSMHRVLSKTHYLVYNFDWVWEQWTLK